MFAVSFLDYAKMQSVYKVVASPQVSRSSWEARLAKAKLLPTLSLREKMLCEGHRSFIAGARRCNPDDAQLIMLNVHDAHDKSGFGATDEEEALSGCVRQSNALNVPRIGTRLLSKQLMADSPDFKFAMLRLRAIQLAGDALAAPPMWAQLCMCRA